MAKKRVTAKKSAPKASRSAKLPSEKESIQAPKQVEVRSERQPQTPGFHVYRHEIDGNPTGAPLIIDIPIAEGRGANPPQPVMVSFTAEMSEEHWPDQFAFRIVSLEGNSLRVMVSRVDKGSSEQGWGVKLIVHVLVVDDAGGS